MPLDVAQYMACGTAHHPLPHAPGMTTIISTLLASMKPLRAVIGTVLIIFVAFSVLAVQFWTELPRFLCASPTEICSSAMILDPVQLGCLCEPANITNGGAGSYRLGPAGSDGENQEWARYKEIPAGLSAASVAPCVGGPKMEEWLYCDGLGESAMRQGSILKR